MNNAPSIVLYLSMIAEALITIYFLDSYFPERRSRYQLLLKAAYSVLYIGALHVQHGILTQYFSDTFYIYLLIHILFMFGYVLLFKKGNFAFKIFIPIVLVSMLTMTGFPAQIVGIIILGKYFGYMTLSYTVSKVFAEVFFAIIARFILKHSMDTLQSYPVSYYWTMIIAPNSNMFLITSLKNVMMGSSLVYYVGTISMLVELLIYYMIWQSCTEYEKRMQLQMEKQQKEYQEKHMNDIQMLVTEYHQLRHDMKNHFVCIDRLLSQNKYQELRDYFYPLTQEIYTLDNRIETGNEIVNQILNIKYATAHQKEIPMKMDILVPPKLMLPDHVTCSLLSNLLDNAIEASEKIDQPEITLTMKMVKDYLIINIKNRIEPWQRENAIKHISTKSDPMMHGLGHKIIESIVEKYNGTSSFEADGDYYIADVMLLMEEEESFL